jgi:tRNA U34 2-thiouridine synthase MnmA/TrmU
MIISIFFYAGRMSWIAGSPPEGIRKQVSKLFSNNGNALSNNEDENTAIDSRNSNDNHIENIDGEYITENGRSFGDSTFRCKYKARYLQPEGDCIVTVRLISEKNRNLSTTELNISGNSINEKIIFNSTNILDNYDNYNINHNSVKAMCSDSINKNSKIDNNYGSTKNCNYNINDYELVVAFDVPQRAVTPGQIVALYMGEECLGGGIISLP